MRITLRKDASADIDYYYHQQFEIYHNPYLIWDRETWEAILSTCDVYRIEVNEKSVGDLILERRARATVYIVDFSLLPEYQGKGIGKAVLEEVKKLPAHRAGHPADLPVKRLGKKLVAVTRKETLDFFLKSGFVLRKKLRNYYDPGVDGYYIVIEN